jgi:leucyl-tRNA---protein transferase
MNLYLSKPNKCSYLDEQESSSLFIDPTITPDKDTYTKLLENGFRRSGNNVYRPHCESCQKCIATRVDSNHFQLKKTQKRCFNKNKDLEVIIKPSSYEEEHYQLYSHYLSSRHTDSGMDDSTEEDYKNFLITTWSNTLLVEFRLDNKLLAVAVTDELNDGLSAVYTYFSPEEQYQKRSLGVNAILWQIEECKRRHLDWLYLGYWIAENRKMAYKNQYQPAEYFINGLWTTNSSQN